MIHYPGMCAASFCDSTTVALIRALLLSPTLSTAALRKEALHCADAAASRCLLYLALQTGAVSPIALVEKHFSVLVTSMIEMRPSHGSKSASWLFFSALVRVAPRAAAIEFVTVVAPVIVEYANPPLGGDLDMRMHALR